MPPLASARRKSCDLIAFRGRHWRGGAQETNCSLWIVVDRCVVQGKRVRSSNQHTLSRRDSTKDLAYKRHRTACMTVASRAATADGWAGQQRVRFTSPVITI